MKLEGGPQGVILTEHNPEKKFDGQENENDFWKLFWIFKNFKASVQPGARFTILGLLV
jgi:hypothetical protein